MDIKNKLRKILTIFGIALAVGLILASFLLVYNYYLKDILTYNRAKRLMGKESFSEAQEIFQKLGRYSDSETMVKQCEYEIALDLLEKGKYSSGYRKLENLGEFNDAVSYKNKHIYNRAVLLLDSGEFDEASELFSEIADYENSADMIKECLYRKAKKYYDDKDFKSSNPIFKELGDYKDSARLLHEKHTYTLVESREATCTEPGFKKFACPCGYTDEYETGLAHHEYRDATCTNPQICKNCGEKKGSPLGHRTGYVNCTRCGEQLAKPQTYTGIGNKNISFSSLPLGAYDVTFTVTVPAGKLVSASVNFYLQGISSVSIPCVVNAVNSSTAVIKTTVEEAARLGGTGRLSVNVGSNYNVSWKIEIDPC